MGTGASDEIKPFDLSSSQKTEGISVSIEATLAISSSGLAAPGIIETAAGCANGNCKAASCSDTLYAAHTLSIMRTLLIID